MGKILIIGSSYSIKNTFSKKFLNENVQFINFRTIWNKRKIPTYDIIILSGYHHKLLKYDLDNFNEYVRNYYKFILDLKNKTNTLIFISTYIPKKISFSRVVYFYKKIVKKLFEKKGIQILSFKKIVDDKFKDTLIFKVLKKTNFEFTDQKDLIKFTNKYLLNKISEPKFFFIKITRPILIERFLRLLDFD